MIEEELISRWKELNIHSAIFEFSCGGDSMNDTNLTFYDENDNIIEDDDFNNEISDLVYDSVDFYVNSDGHYQGEFGTVDITVEEDTFLFTKNSSEEYYESDTDTVKVETNEEDNKLFKEIITNVEGNEDEFVINYKKDFILTDEIEEKIEDLVEKLQEMVANYETNNDDYNESRSFSYNPDSDLLSINYTYIKVVAAE